jgi:uncharacterized protein YcnI
MKKMISGLLASLVLAIGVPAIASAHVVVTPRQAVPGDELLFSMSVPNERALVSVTSIRLLIPKDVGGVTPTATDGWTIKLEGSSEAPTAIVWTGTIPAGQRADLSFSAQAPESGSELDWKAYQTYSDGSMASWDQSPSDSGREAGGGGSYSITKLTTTKANPADTTAADNSGMAKLAFVISLAALAISLSTFITIRRCVPAKSGPTTPSLPN